MPSALFTRPCHDDVTGYLHFYSKRLLIEAKEKGFKTINKEKQDATKEIVSPIIEKQNPNFIMFNGHGSPTAIAGHKDEILIIYGENENLLKKRVTYSLSCSSAQKLGKSIADNKTTFIGYTDEFALGMDGNCQASIHRDKRAKLFLEPSNLLVSSLLKGNSASNAVKKAKELMKKNISILRTDPFPDAKDYLPYLFNNYMILEVFGDQEATII
ncbi:MAG: hypothetical protein ABIH53_00940 [archaeon]